MAFLDDLYSKYSTLGFQPGFIDLLTIIQDEPREYFLSDSLSTIDYRMFLPVQNFNVNITQETSVEQRYVGEGADPTTFLIPQLTITSRANLPVYVSNYNLLDNSFMSMWNYCKFAYWGTGTSLIAKINEEILPIGSSSSVVTNIEDFISLLKTEGTIDCYIIKDNQILETITVNDYNKTNQVLYFTSLTTKEYTDEDSFIVSKVKLGSLPVFEPSFSLLSLREGVLTPSLVSKLQINFQSGTPVSVEIDFSSLDIIRRLQVDLVQNNIESLFNNYYNKSPIASILNGSMMTIEPYSTDADNYGVQKPLYNSIISGYQTLDIPYAAITSISINIDNQIEHAHTLKSLKTNIGDRQNENSRAMMLVSGGRKIYGTINYLTSLSPWAFIEKLSGPSGFNHGGFTLRCPYFKIDIPNVVWSPSSSEGKADGGITRSLNWSMVSNNLDSMPDIEFLNPS